MGPHKSIYNSYSPFITLTGPSQTCPESIVFQLGFLRYASFWQGNCLIYVSIMLTFFRSWTQQLWSPLCSASPFWLSSHIAPSTYCIVGSILRCTCVGISRKIFDMSQSFIEIGMTLCETSSNSREVSTCNLLLLFRGFSGNQWGPMRLGLWGKDQGQRGFPPKKN